MKVESKTDDSKPKTIKNLPTPIILVIVMTSPIPRPVRQGTEELFKSVNVEFGQSSFDYRRDGQTTTSTATGDFVFLTRGEDMKVRFGLREVISRDIRYDMSSATYYAKLPNGKWDVFQSSSGFLDFSCKGKDNEWVNVRLRVASNDGSFDYKQYGQTVTSTVNSQRYVDINTKPNTTSQIEVGNAYIAADSRTVRYTDQQQPAILVKMPDGKLVEGNESFLGQVYYRDESGKKVKLNLMGL